MQRLCQVDRKHDFTGGGSGGDQRLPETQTGVSSVASTKSEPVSVPFNFHSTPIWTKICLA